MFFCVLETNGGVFATVQKLNLIPVYFDICKHITISMKLYKNKVVKGINHFYSPPPFLIQILVLLF